MVRRRSCVVALVVSLAMAAVLSTAAVASAAKLRAGVGQADITPLQTGYYLGGWTLKYRVARGQSTRLFARAIVLRRGRSKVALAAADLFAITAGMQSDVVARLRGLGFSRQNILLQATHTHTGPGGWANNPDYNLAAPEGTPSSVLTNPLDYFNLLVRTPADKQLYTFLVDRIALAIRRANRDLAPAAAGWGHSTLVGVTQNRSLEAHLANHGINDPTYGSGSVSQDPLGYVDTIDPSVDVLRIDKFVRRRARCGGVRCTRTGRVPIGAWSTFADHGTIVHSNFEIYSGDHLGVASRVLSAWIRRVGHVPARQPVVDVYPNADEGDQTAGLQHLGPSGADEVGRAEAAKMFAAWKQAGRHLSRTPPLALRWTVSCFCGRPTATGNVAAVGKIGLPFATGAPEGRGPLYEQYHLNFSGTRNPVPSPDQGDKVVAPIGSFPPAVPLMVLRIGRGAIAALPLEATVQVGRSMRHAVLATLARAGVNQVAIAGLANEYVNYVTTPAEYSWQSYEGGSTIYGPNEATFLQERLVELAGDLAGGRPAPASYGVEVSYGVHPDGPPYPQGAGGGSVTSQPAARYARLAHASLAWQGGPSGHDRPLDKPFVLAQRRRGRRWTTLDNDLGLNMMWRVDDAGHYTLDWEIPLSAPTGTYRLVVTASRYTLRSRPFKVRPFGGLIVRRAGPLAVRLDYPPADPISDLTSRPAQARGGAVRFLVNGRRVTVRRKHGSTFTVRAPAGAHVSVAAGAARDLWRNTNSGSVSLQ